MINSRGWFTKIIRPFFGGIDALIYNLLTWIVEGIFNLSSLAVSSDFIRSIYQRIYAIVGIFMIFKLAFSFIQYVVSPDKMSDKEQGAGKVIGRTIVMVCMLICLPILFFEPAPFGTDNGEPTLTKLQNAVIRTLPNLILGPGGSEGDDIKSESKNYGEFMALSMLRSFYYPSECDDESSSCDIVSGDNITSIYSKDKTSGKDSSFVGSLSEQADGDSSSFRFNYMWPLSTVVGILLVLIMVGITIDVSIRLFKLIVLQILAPIPVMSYIDPKSSKDGAFASWLKTFITTYIDIFVKLAVVYSVLLLLNRIFAGGLFESGWADEMGFMSKTFIYVFLTIGLLKFAKDAPKFIKDALGIKDSGGGSGGFMGKALAGAAGAAAGFAGGVAGGGGIAGGLSGAASGFGAGAANAGSGKPLNAYSKIRDEQAKALGKPQGGMQGKIQRASNRRALAKMGISEGRTSAVKDKMAAAQTAMELAKVRGDDVGYSDAADEYGKYASVYDSMDKAMETAGVKRGTYEKSHRGIGDKFKSKGNAIKYAATKPKDNLTEIGEGITTRLKDTVKDTFHVRAKGSATSYESAMGGKRYTQRRNDRIAEKYAEGLHSDSTRKKNADSVGKDENYR